MKELDETDMKILKALRDNCKRPVRELAKDLHVHPNTLLQRIKRLEKREVIRKYQANIDYHKVGYDIHAIIMIKITKRGLEDPNLLKEVAAIPEIEALYAITGTADCIAILRAENKDNMVEVLKNIQSHDKVLRTITHLILVTYKHPHEFNPIKVKEIGK
jgi:Lrp/AsnC family leucine-responsive transcriptional regulator